MYKYLLKLLGKSKADQDQTPLDMKYLIVGLGNVGNKYAGTRHNIGFEVMDYLAHKYELSFEMGQLGEMTTYKTKGRQVYLLKPNTYMNKSGKSVKYWLQKLKVPMDNLLIVVDDLHLPLAKLRLRAKGKDAGHNGLKDIEQQLGTQKYHRIKFGIGDDFKQGRQVEFVLGKWSKKEVEELSFAIPEAAEMVNSFVSIGAKFTMDNYNKAKQ